MATSARPRKPKSGNPAKAALQASKAAEWKAASKPAPLELPSGHVALVKMPGLAKLLAEGLISDSLTPMAQKAIDSANGKKAVGMSDAEMEEMARDPQKLSAAFDTFDKVLCYSVVEPKVHYYKDEDGVIIPEEDRDEDELYSDEVDLQDKIFVFTVVAGGSKDLEKFRSEFGESLDNLLAGSVDEGATK